MALKPFHGFNHNDTLLGSYSTKAEANADTSEYMMQTGNAGIVVAVADLSPEQRHAAQQYAERH